MIVDHFDEMLEQSANEPLVMGIALHPSISSATATACVICGARWPMWRRIAKKYG
jgi:hypothetical protein